MAFSLIQQDQYNKYIICCDSESILRPLRADITSDITKKLICTCDQMIRYSICINIEGYDQLRTMIPPSMSELVHQMLDYFYKQQQLAYEKGVVITIC